MSDVWEAIIYQSYTAPPGSPEVWVERVDGTPVPSPTSTKAYITSKGRTKTKRTGT